MNSFVRVFLLLGFSNLITQVQAYDLDLLQETSTAVPSHSVRTTHIESAFTLMGTSRFGNDYQASLLSRDGKRILVHWKKGEVNAIGGFSSYRITAIDSRSVFISLPEGESCSRDLSIGVGCRDEDRIVVLSLQNAKALLSIRESREGNVAEEINARPLVNTESLDFLASRRENFQFERIAIESVPPGKRLVRTAFGDRLVPMN